MVLLSLSDASCPPPAKKEKKIVPCVAYLHKYTYSMQIEVRSFTSIQRRRTHTKNNNSQRLVEKGVCEQQSRPVHGTAEPVALSLAALVRPLGRIARSVGTIIIVLYSIYTKRN